MPLRPFRPFSGEWGPGASSRSSATASSTWGDILFKDDLANGNSWTNDVSMVDLGVNWYPNRWISSTSTGSHTAFGHPVLVNEAKGIFGRSTDLFWVRCQVYF